jgi:hypothetical protein
MAAYAASVASAMKRAVKVDQVTGIGMFTGRVNLTNYNSTLGAITAITGKFKSVVSVIGGTAEGGDWVEWVHASGSFKAYVSNATTGVTEEVANDVDVGEFDFIAYGLI